MLTPAMPTPVLSTFRGPEQSSPLGVLVLAGDAALDRQILGIAAAGQGAGGEGHAVETGHFAHACVRAGPRKKVGRPVPVVHVPGNRAVDHAGPDLPSGARYGPRTRVVYGAHA